MPTNLNNLTCEELATFVENEANPILQRVQAYSMFNERCIPGPNSSGGVPIKPPKPPIKV